MFVYLPTNTTKHIITKIKLTNKAPRSSLLALLNQVRIGAMLALLNQVRIGAMLALLNQVRIGAQGQGYPLHLHHHLEVEEAQGGGCADRYIQPIC